MGFGLESSLSVFRKTGQHIEMVRAPYYDKEGLKKGAWSREEDEILTTYVQKYGHPNWRQLPKFAGLNRCGKSCRLRWMNYLRPDLKHGNYTPEEGEMIIKLHKKLGNKWAMIAERFPGRTDNEIKNHWHSHLKKRLKRSETKPELKSNPSNHVSEPETTLRTEQGDQTNHALFHNISESSLSSSTEFESCSKEENCSSFVSEPSMNCSRGEEDTVANSWQTYFEGFSHDFWTEPFIVENSTEKDYDVSIYQPDKEETASYLPYDSEEATDFLVQVMQYLPNCF